MYIYIYNIYYVYVFALVLEYYNILKRSVRIKKIKTRRKNFYIFGARKEEWEQKEGQYLDYEVYFYKVKVWEDIW